MKKIVSLFLVICMLLSVLLSGCDQTISVDKGKPDKGDSQQEETDPSEPSSPENTGCKHEDENDDGNCDVCQITVLVNLDFYVVNDLHGKLCDSSQQPGVDELSTFLKTKYNADDNAIFLSSGDMWQGSAESNLTNGFIITEWMNAMGFVAMTLGNHEFDWGEDPVRANKAVAEFPFLAINIYNKNTDQPVDYCDGSVMIERGGLQIGIIGAIGDCYSSIAPDFTKDIYFKTGSELTELVKNESERLREAGADLIIYSLHDGGSGGYGNVASDSEFRGYYDTALSDGYVDLVFEGHTHQDYTKYDKHGVYHLQGGGENQGICHADVNVNSVTGTVTVVTADYIDADDYGYLSDDPIVENLMGKYEEQVAPGYEVLGYNRYNRSSKSLRETGAMLYYQKGEEIWGDEYDIVLGGGYLNTRSPGYLKNGNVTYADLMMIFPFDNVLVLCSIKGRDLISKFLETSNDNYFVYCGDYGDSVRHNIDPNGTYYIIVDSYTSTYAPNNLTEIERYNERYYLRDMMAEYVKAGNFA